MGLYWDQRKHWLYHQVAMGMVKAEHSRNPCRSILDVGGRDCEYLLACDIPQKTRLDIEKQVPLTGVRDLKSDFNISVFNDTFDVVVCLEVLEHIPHARWFSQRLLRLATRLVVISVPFCWPKGDEVSHVHDPIDLDKLLSWTEHKPDGFQVVGATARKFLVAEYRL